MNETSAERVTRELSESWRHGMLLEALVLLRYAHAYVPDNRIGRFLAEAREAGGRLGE